MKENMGILSNTPIDCVQSHRLAYIKHDENHLKPYKVMFLPYLNERKLYLDPLSNKGNDYFYTSMQV